MIPFSPPRIDQKIIDEVVDTLRSGWITTGPKTKLFEDRLGVYCRVQSVVCLNSATAGLELMLRWFGVGEGDEVILPAYTYSASANVIVHTGAKPVFVDVTDDFAIDPDAIRKAITPNTKVIMPVDIGGWPCDYRAIHAIVGEMKSRFAPRTDAQRKLGRILILSDAAHSLGAMYDGNPACRQADLSVFSFHAVKNLTTAEGGAVALNLPEPFDNAKEYASLKISSLHGQNKDALSKMQAGSWKYDIVEAGYKMNMTDILASIGLVELSRYESETLPKRKEICQAYSKAFQEKDWAILPKQSDTANGRISSWHLYPLRIRGADEQTRDAIIRSIAEKEVSVNVHFIPVPMMSFYKKLGYDIRNYPRTYSLYCNEISLPVYYDLGKEDQEQVIRAVMTSVEEIIQTAIK